MEVPIVTQVVNYGLNQLFGLSQTADSGWYSSAAINQRTKLESNRDSVTRLN